MNDTYGTWAVITGASSGIGASFSRALAASGFCLVLIARREERMKAIVEEISQIYPAIQAKIIGVDLTSENALSVISKGVAGLDIGLVVNNAGVETVGEFICSDQEEIHRVIALNVQAFTAVTHFFGGILINRAEKNKTRAMRSGMIMISSMAASKFPYMAVYSASKAYESTLGLCLRAEWAAHHVDVTVIEPGFIKTDMAARVKEKMEYEKLGFFAMDVDTFVQYALHAFQNRKIRFTPGALNRLNLFLFSILPEFVYIPLAGFMMRKMLTKNDQVKTMARGLMGENEMDLKKLQ